MEEQAWWVSWYSSQADGAFELHTPWWISGWSENDEGDQIAIMVGAVRARSEDDAFDIVEASYDVIPPNGVARRFCDLLLENEKLPWEHEGGRFQLAEWMQWTK